MGVGPGTPARVPLGTLGLAAVGYAGLAMCITLIVHGMRAVMAVGGSCGSGGSYVWAVPPCPDAAVPATFVGIFGLFLFGGMAMLYGGRIGGAWGSVPLLGWVALFGSLGWNFVDYGLFNPPEETGPDVGLVIVGIVFWIMAFGPLLLVLPSATAGWRRGGTSAEAAGSRVMTRIGKPATGSRVGSPIHMVDGGTESEREAMTEIATAFGLAIRDAEAETPADPLGRASVAEGATGERPVATRDLPGAGGTEAFEEGTQALLDRLERLADMRDRGLLDPAEYETAKDAVMRELEARR